MTARPGRIASEFRIDTPEPRGEEFRTSADYAGYCREVSERAGAVLFRAARRMSSLAEHRPHPAARRRARRGPRGCGNSWCASTTSSPTCCRARYLVFQTLVGDWPVLSESLGVTLLHHAGRLYRRGRRRRRAGAVVQPVEMAGIFAVSLCGDPAGHACDRDCAAVADLSAAADRGDRLRLDRRVLPGAVQHHARAEFGRPQSRRAVSALWRVAAADAAVPEIAGGAALYPRRLADRRAACR